MDIRGRRSQDNKKLEMFPEFTIDFVGTDKRGTESQEGLLRRSMSEVQKLSALPSFVKPTPSRAERRSHVTCTTCG